MADWLWILVGGMLGSSHCVGMCGGFVVTIGAASPTPMSNLARQLTYGCGRVFTYAFLGVVAGFLGIRFAGSLSTVANGQAVLAILAGSLLVFQGVPATGLFRWTPAPRGQQPCLSGMFLAGLLTAPGLANAFLAGLLTGFLPCGLVYAFLSLAMSSGSLSKGGLIMILFGIGTIPLLAASGCAGSFLSIAARKHLLRIAGVSVVIAGLVTIHRGLNFLLGGQDSATMSIPFCG